MVNNYVSKSESDEIIENEETFWEKTKKKLQKHKKKIIVGCVSFVSVGAVVLGFKKQEEIKSFIDNWRATLDDILRDKSISVDDQLYYQDIQVDDSLLEDSYDDTLLNIYLDGIQDNNIDSIMSSYEVRRHIRNLPRGWKASPEKIATALENNIVLQQGQTWVDTYEKGVSNHDNY